MAGLPSHKSEEQDPEAANLAKDYDHAVLDARYSSKPTSCHTDDIQEGDIEDGLVKERDRAKRRRNWTGFWRTMTVGLRRGGSLDVIYEDVPDQDGLLQNTNTQRRTRRKRNWYNCCVFGGISGLAVLYGPLSLPCLSC